METFVVVSEEFRDVVVDCVWVLDVVLSGFHGFHQVTLQNICVSCKLYNLNLDCDADYRCRCGYYRSLGYNVIFHLVVNNLICGR